MAPLLNDIDPVGVGRGREAMLPQLANEVPMS